MSFEEPNPPTINSEKVEEELISQSSSVEDIHHATEEVVTKSVEEVQNTEKLLETAAKEPIYTKVKKSKKSKKKIAADEIREEKPEESIKEPIIKETAKAEETLISKKKQIIIDQPKSEPEIIKKLESKQINSETKEIEVSTNEVTSSPVKIEPEQESEKVTASSSRDFWKRMHEATEETSPRSLSPRMNSFNRNAKPEYRQVKPQWSPKSNPNLGAVAEKLEASNKQVESPVFTEEKCGEAPKVLPKPKKATKSCGTSTPPNSPSRRFVLKSSYESPISFN